MQQHGKTLRGEEGGAYENNFGPAMVNLYPNYTHSIPKLDPTYTQSLHGKGTSVLPGPTFTHYENTVIREKEFTHR